MKVVRLAIPRLICLIALAALASSQLGCPCEEDDDTYTGDDDTQPAGDADGDGYATADGDCDDTDPDVHPGADDVPYDGIDQDCDGSDLCDADGDGHDSDEHGGDDCNDLDATIFPGAIEVCGDGTDQDCTHDPDDGLTDADGDGYIDWHCNGGDDCDDADASVRPGMEVYVPTDHPDVRTAVNAVCSDSTIYVEEGTYYGNVVAATKFVRIIGVGEPAATILVGDGLASTVVLGVVGGMSELTGVTIQGGLAEHGGGVLCNGECLIQDCIVSGNVASCGGGVAIVDSESFTITGCEISGNAAWSGQGLYVAWSTGGTVSDTAVTGHDCDDCFTAALAFTYSEVEMTRITVSDNSDRGVSLENSIVSISESVLSENRAGGAYFRLSTVEFHFNTVVDNYWTGGYPAGVYCWGSEVTGLETNDISGNVNDYCSESFPPDCADLGCIDCTGC